MIYNNKPYIISENNDLFGTYFKAEAIKAMLDNNMEYFDENNMVSLYGEWGSGKTSIMEYLKTNLKNYNIVFFEAWRYEKDSNLALSLFEVLIDKIEDEKKISTEIIETVKHSGNTFLNLGKNLLFNTKLTVAGLNVDLGKASKDTIEEMDRLLERTSFYNNLKKFNKLYKNLLEQYYQKSQKKILVFIDDLDRCAPENILDLLSSIKHFFTDSTKIVYFSGVDKEAVNKAINIRYNNILKSDEYLEKIFDVTFNMPKTQDIDHLINDFIAKVNYFNNPHPNTARILKDFLLYIRFTNPRKLKKLFNKYLFLCDLANNNSTNMYKHIPVNFTQHEPVQMFFTLFLILLYEFYREQFDSIVHYELKFAKIKSLFIDGKPLYLNSNTSINVTDFLNHTITKIKNHPFNITNDILEVFLKANRDNRLLELFFLLMPLDVTVDTPHLGSTSGDDLFSSLERFLNQFKTSEYYILSLFLSFILIEFSKGYIHESTVCFDLKELIKMTDLYF